MMMLKRLTAFALALVLFIGLIGCAQKPHNCPTEDPYVSISKEDFYADYSPACCNQDAQHRSKHGFLSGSLELPQQYAKESEKRPMNNGNLSHRFAAFPIIIII